MRVTTLCMLFVSVVIVFLTMNPKENEAADRAFVALKKAAGIALLLQRKRFRVIPIPLPLPLPLPIPIELKQKAWPSHSWPVHHSWPSHAPSWPTVSHSWSPPTHIESWSSGGDSWSASEGYGSVADIGYGDNGY